jgi:hypothetical protein
MDPDSSFRSIQSDESFREAVARELRESAVTPGASSAKDLCQRIEKATSSVPWDDQMTKHLGEWTNTASPIEDVNKEVSDLYLDESKNCSGLFSCSTPGDLFRGVFVVGRADSPEDPKTFIVEPKSPDSSMGSSESRLCKKEIGQDGEIISEETIEAGDLIRSLSPDSEGDSTYVIFRSLTPDPPPEIDLGGGKLALFHCYQTEDRCQAPFLHYSCGLGRDGNCGYYAMNAYIGCDKEEYRLPAFGEFMAELLVKEVGFSPEYAKKHVYDGPGNLAASDPRMISDFLNANGHNTEFRAYAHVANEDGRNAFGDGQDPLDAQVTLSEFEGVLRKRLEDPGFDRFITGRDVHFVAWRKDLTNNLWSQIDSESSRASEMTEEEMVQKFMEDQSGEKLTGGMFGEEEDEQKIKEPTYLIWEKQEDD